MDGTSYYFGDRTYFLWSEQAGRPGQGSGRRDQKFQRRNERRRDTCEPPACRQEVIRQFQFSKPFARNISATKDRGNPTTLENSPTMRSVQREAPPWMAYAPALSMGSPPATYC